MLSDLKHFNFEEPTKEDVIQYMKEFHSELKIKDGRAVPGTGKVYRKIV